MLGCAEIVDGQLRAVDADSVGSDVRVEKSPTSFELSSDAPGTTPIYYRVGYGQLDWGSDLAAFVPAGARPELDNGALLSLLTGLSPAPDSTAIPGVRRLTVGTRVRVDSDGVSVTRCAPTLSGRRQKGLVDAVARVLEDLPSGYAIAYSGGLSSRFLAVCGIEAGHRPTLLHADLGPAMSDRTPVAEIPGLRLQRVPVDLSELLDHHRVTGAEPSPPLPDQELPRRILARLAEANGTHTLANGALLKELASVRLVEAGTGTKGWRLLTCEPFHVSGSIRTLREARDLIGSGKVGGPGAAPEDAERSDGDDGPPGLTDAGREALASSRRSAMAVWKQHLDELPSVIARLDAGVHERGLLAREGLPATNPDVLATVAATKPSKLGQVRDGLFRNHLPLYRALAAHNVARVPETSPGFRLRLAAAVHLHRERDKVIAELTQECALADLGLIEPAPLIEILRDGKGLADHALTLLRLVWIDQWLRGR